MSISVTLKLATSMDGRIALNDGTSQWITSSQARAKVHELRANHDVVLVGAGTVRADDPLLTARTVPLPSVQPVRMVADTLAQLSPTSRLAQSVGIGRVVVASANPSAPDLQAIGVEVWRCGAAGEEGRIDLEALLRRCEAEGLPRIFLEGGGILAAAFVRQGLVDRIEWFRAPILIGGDGRPAMGALQLTDMASAPRYGLASSERIGDDVHETYVKEIV